MRFVWLVVVGCASAATKKPAPEKLSAKENPRDPLSILENDEADQVEDVPHRDHGPKLSVVDTRHRHHRTEKRNPYSYRLTIGRIRPQEI